MRSESQSLPARDVLSPDDILTPEQLAKRLQVPLSWVYEKTRAGGKYGGIALPSLSCGRYLRFCWPDVCQWLRSNPKLVRKKNPLKNKRKKLLGERSEQGVT